jgi:hypothetical protein
MCFPLFSHGRTIFPLKTIRSFQHQAVCRLPVAPSAQGPVQRQVAHRIGREKLTEHLAKGERRENSPYYKVVPHS